MKKLLFYLVFAFITTVFTACPYSAEFPIDSPSIPIDKAFLGTWEVRSSTDNEYVVSAKGDYVYLIEKKSKSSSDVTTYFGHISVVDNVQYMNISEGEDAFQYYFYKVTKKGDLMIDLEGISENVDEQFSSSDELKKFIAANQKNSYFFDKSADTYIKVN